MPAGYTKLEIGGVEVPPGGEPCAHLLRHSESLDGDSNVELAGRAGGNIAAPEFVIGSSVVVTYDAGGADQVVGFRGTITRAVPAKGPNGFQHVYGCEGKHYDMDRLPCWNATSSTMNFYFNMPTDDREYSASLTGMTVGAICKRILQDSESALNARGIFLDHLADFDVLDWVPRVAVRIGGERLLSTLRGWLATPAPNYRIVLEYTATATQVRLSKMSGGMTVKPVVLGGGPIEFQPGEYSIEQCATRVRIIGTAEIEGFELDTESGTLSEDWDPLIDEPDWTILDFEEVGEAADEGDVISMTSTDVTVQSDDAGREWDANFWAGTRRGRLKLEYEALEGDGFELISQMTRNVISNDALTSAGTAEIVVDRGYPMNTYTRYKLYGIKEDSERPQVFRRYKPTLTAVREHLAHWFAINEPFETNNGTTTVWTTAPRGGIEINGIFHEIPIEVDIGNGTIWFAEPVVAHPAVGNSRTDLETPGSELTVPKVRVFLPVAVRPMEVQCPADTATGPYGDPVGTAAYGGTAYDWHGLRETWTIEVPEWQDRNAESQMQALACELHDSVKDVRMTAGLTFYQFNAHEFFPLKNRAVRLSAVTGPGSAVPVDLGRWGDADLPIRALSISWGGPSGMAVSCSLSTERRPLHGTDFYTHGISLEGVTNDPFGFTAGFPNVGVPLMGLVSPIMMDPGAMALGGIAEAQALSMGTTGGAQQFMREGMASAWEVGAPMDQANQAFMAGAGADVASRLDRWLLGQDLDASALGGGSLYSGLKVDPGMWETQRTADFNRADERDAWMNEIAQMQKSGAPQADIRAAQEFVNRTYGRQRGPEMSAERILAGDAGGAQERARIAAKMRAQQPWLTDEDINEYIRQGGR